MRKRSHYYRIRLIAYDALPTPFWRPPSRLPSPIPASLRPRVRPWRPRRIVLVKIEHHRPLLEDPRIL